MDANYILADITEATLRWVGFLGDELAIMDVNTELAMMMYNQDPISIDIFFRESGILLDKEEYLYDYIFENIDEHLLYPMRLVVDPTLILIDVRQYLDFKTGKQYISGMFKQVTTKGVRHAQIAKLGYPVVAQA